MATLPGVRRADSARNPEAKKKRSPSRLLGAPIVRTWNVLRRSWTRGPDVYLASREDIFHVKRLLGELPVVPDSTYVGIIGGLGTLNYILAIAPRKIVLVDANRDQVEYAKCVVELIEMCDSREAFVEAFFSRRFVEDEHRFLGQTGDPGIVSETLQKIHGKDPFRRFFPAIRDGVFVGDGLEIRGNGCCRRLRLYGPERGTAQGDNYLYFGEGWLKDDTSFSRLRSILRGARPEFVHSPIEELDLDPVGNCLYLHGSNVVDSFPSPCRAFSAGICRRLSRQDRDVTFFSFSTYHPVNITTFKKFHPESDDGHTDCARKVAVYTKGKVVLELIPGEHCFGRELCAREIEVRAFRGHLPNRRFDVVVSHILYGSGHPKLSKRDFERAIDGMLALADEVVIVEHNSESLDFGGERLLDVGEIAGLLGKHHGLEMQVEFARGHRDNRRNVILWVKAPGRAEAH